MRAASAQADECGVGFGDMESVCYFADFDCPESRLDFLNIVFLIQPGWQTRR
jgi:hypothetical protein